MAVSWLRHVDIGNVFCFSFPIFYREESSFYNSLDQEYFVSQFMYYLQYVISKTYLRSIHNIIVFC